MECGAIFGKQVDKIVCSTSEPRNLAIHDVVFRCVGLAPLNLDLERVK